MEWSHLGNTLFLCDDSIALITREKEETCSGYSRVPFEHAKFAAGVFKTDGSLLFVEALSRISNSLKKTTNNVDKMSKNKMYSILAHILR